jgi:pyridoxamine 5'-phosphate oxidase
VNELRASDFDAVRDPMDLFQTWFEEARAREPNDPEAMALATVDASGTPNVRMVLLKGAGPKGFVFYTNEGSAKGRELEAAPRAALLFHWKSLRRQVRIRGAVGAVSEAESDAYFATRSRPSQLGAWASRQSRPLESRAVFEGEIAEVTARFAGGEAPRPPYWRGFRVEPSSIEFWRDGQYRLHERLAFTRLSSGDGWARERLYP